MRAYVRERLAQLRSPENDATGGAPGSYKRYREARDTAIRSVNAALMQAQVSVSRRLGALSLAFGTSTSTIKKALAGQPALHGEP